MINELSEQFPHIFCITLYEVVTGKLDYLKLCARRVPKLLIESHKTRHMGSFLDFHLQYDEQGDEFLNKTVTSDEIWVSSIKPEIKQQSMDWGHTDLPKQKTRKSARKVTETIVWNVRGVTLIQITKHGNIINLQVYCDPSEKLR